MAEVTLEEAPRKVRDMYEKAHAALERNNFDYAIDMFTTVLDLEPKLLLARKALRAAEVKKFKEKKGGAVTHIMSSITGIGTLTSAQSQMKKKPEQALNNAEKLLRKDPLNKSFINTFVDAAVACEMPEAAVATLEVARDFYPKDVAVLQRLAELYAEINLTRKARECCEELVRLKPKDPKVLKALKDATAIDTMQKGGWEDAKSYRDVMKDSKEATLLEQQSKAVKSDKDSASLIEETLRKIEEEPDNVNYKRALADLYTKNKHYDEAIKVLDDVLEASGGSDPQIDRTRTTVKIKKFDQEIADLEAAGDAETAAAKKQAKKEFLLTDAADRVKRYPNDLQFKYDYGVLLFEEGNHNEAIQQFQQSQRNPQRRLRSLYYMGLCFREKGQNDIAVEQLEAAAKEINTMDNTKKDIYYTLGLIHEDMGQPEKAVAFYKDIYGVDIGYKDVAEKIEKSYNK